jgi:diadenylate cyclase
LSDVLSNISNFTGIKNIYDVLRVLVDISIVSYIIYKIIQLVKETRAAQLIKGILAIFVLKYASQYLGLKTINYILTYAIQIIGFALVVLFQPELRKSLERIGRSRFKNLFGFQEDSVEIKTISVIDEVIGAVAEMSKNYTGALIVIERETGLKEFINKGVLMDSIVSSALLMNVFTPNTPLHDGAVVISDFKIRAAACILPLTDNPNLTKELGTRHRAAIGISEISDCLAITVSEETGKISFASNGTLTRNLNADTLRKLMNGALLEPRHIKKRTLWKVKNKDG